MSKLSKDKLVDRGAQFTSHISFAPMRPRANTYPRLSFTDNSFGDPFAAGDHHFNCTDDHDSDNESDNTFYSPTNRKSDAIANYKLSVPKPTPHLKHKTNDSMGDSPMTPFKSPETPSPLVSPLYYNYMRSGSMTPNQLFAGMSSPLVSPYSVIPVRSIMNYGNMLSPIYSNSLSPMFGQSNGLQTTQHFTEFGSNDPIVQSAKSHRNAATHADPRHTWSGSVPNSAPNKTPVYSCKVFLGGVPWEMTDHDIKLTFSRFGNVNILRPGHHVRLSRTSQNKDKAGYLYLIFESDKQVKSLLSACIHDFSNGGKYYFALNQSRYRPKDVQIIPWNVNDTTFVKSPSARVDANKTVFVGALHGMLTAEGLALILEDLFGGVVYVGIDTDKHKYPIGSGRVTFSTTKSYTKAVQAAFIDVKSARFQKKIQIDPFLEDSNCSHCRTEKGPIFCRDLCMTYLCRNCWDITHSNEAMRNHQPIMRTKTPIMRNQINLN